MNNGFDVNGMNGNARVIRLNMLTLAAVLFSTISWFLILTGILPLFFGSLALVFAFLSKGKELKMNRLTRNAAIGAFLSMVIGAVLTVLALRDIWNDPSMMDYLNTVFEKTNGISIYEYLGNLGISTEGH